MSITPAAVSALAQYDTLSLLGDLSDDLSGLFIRHDCPKGNHEDGGAALPAGAILALPMLAALALPMRTVFVIDQIVGVLVAFQHDIATAATIATIRPTKGFKFFTSETDAATAALSRLHFNYTFIDKHEAASCIKARPCQAARGKK